MGQMSYERYEEIIKKGILKTPLVKLEMLRQEDESVYDEIIKTPLKGSTLNITNQSGCRRSLTMNLNNNDGSFLPTPNGNLWINTKFKFSIGIQDTNGDTIFFPQGVFCLAHSEPEVTSELSNKIVTINASDKWSLSETVTGSIFQIGINQSITDNIRKILNLIKDSKNPILKTILADITQYDLRWDNNSTYGQILKDLGNMFQRDCYYNEMGVLVYEDMPSTESLEVIWNFNKLDRVYMSGKRVFRFDQMYNQVYVRSDTTSGYTYSGLAQNTDLTSSSNIYLNSINTLDISDSKLQSDTACLKEAQYLLEKNKRVQDSIEITCLPLPHATVNKAFTIEDNNLSTFKNYYAIQSVSLPLDLSQNMSILGFRYNDTTDFQDLTSESGNIHELPTGDDRMTDDSNAITQNDLRKFVTGVILKIIDKRLSENKNTEIYPATIISTDSTNHYANIKITTGGQVSILNNVKNKSVNILNNGDKVFAVAPNGDLNNLYVGTNLIGNGINGQDIVANSIQANSIQANSITADEIQAGSITANEIASNTITAESGIIASLDAGKITTGVLSADRIDTNNLNARRITTPGSILHGTIGSWQEATQNINGFQLYNTQENRSVFRIADMNMTWAGDLLRYSVLQGNADGLILTPSNTTYNSNNSAEGFLDAAGQFIYLGGGTITLASGGQGGNSVNVSSSAIDIICNNTSANKGIGVSATAIEFEVGFDDGGKSWNYHLIRNTIDNGTSQDYYILSSRNVMDFIMNEDSNGLGVHCNNGTTYWAYNFNASDERLKTNIKPITTNCSSIINQINLKEFDFIKTGEHIEVGTIAQQLSKINKKFSKILYTTEDGTNFFAPDYNSILPYIIGAIQELSAKSKSLETRVTTLENSIQELKASNRVLFLYKKKV